MRRYIPEETQLSLHTYSIHRDPRNFYMPDAFLPERWLSNGAPAGEHNTSAFFPFGYGPTTCVGKNLALMEMRMLLCWMLRRFRFSKAPGVTYVGWEERIRDWNVIHHDPLLVRISRTRIAGTTCVSVTKCTFRGRHAYFWSRKATQMP
ncbi:cytochrome P450, partial [Lactarius sanguifluus]